MSRVLTGALLNAAVVLIEIRYLLKNFQEGNLPNFVLIKANVFRVVSIRGINFNVSNMANPFKMELCLGL